MLNTKQLESEKRCSSVRTLQIVQVMLFANDSDEVGLKNISSLRGFIFLKSCDEFDLKAYCFHFDIFILIFWYVYGPKKCVSGAKRSVTCLLSF